ncbi:hypothetical protein QTP88_028735 [Uroleucon formosanum]
MTVLDISTNIGLKANVPPAMSAPPTNHSISYASPEDYGLKISLPIIIPVVLNIMVHKQDHPLVHFQMKNTTRLIKLKRMYCEKFNVFESEISLLYNGIEITENDTPSCINMKDGDVLERHREEFLEGGVPMVT